jgi:hypothetical protein
MVFRIFSLAVIVCVGVVAATGTPIAPAHAAGSDISYNEVSRFVTGAAPAPGSYANGSFDADFQAATAKHKGGIFNMIGNVMNMMKNGFASTSYFLNNMEREDSFQDNTATIQLPDKNQIIHLDLGKKTYYITSPSSGNITLPPSQPTQPRPQQSMPPPQPGTANVVITVTTKSIGSLDIGGANADGYQMSFKIVSTNATGSCSNGTFETNSTEYVTSYPEPHIVWPSKNITPAMKAMMSRPPELQSFKPGCTPKIKTETHIGPTAPSGRLIAWQMISIGGSAMAQGQQVGGSAGMVLERGDIKQLTSADAGTFAPPAGFTQVQPPSQ